MFKESDWKKFQGLIVKVRERYLADQNAKLVQILTDPKRTETERFWDAVKQSKVISKDLTECLDDHSRSRMEIFMRRMLRVGMLVKGDLAGFSDELQNRLLQSE
jgi:hypothetical protein